MRRGEACTNTLASVAIMLVVMRTVLPLYYALMLHSCKLAHSLTQRLKAHNDVATAALQRLQLRYRSRYAYKLAHSHNNWKHTTMLDGYIRSSAEAFSYIVRGKTGYTPSLSPSRPPNNTLNTQSRAQQTHSRSRSLRAHPHRAANPSSPPGRELPSRQSL